MNESTQLDNALAVQTKDILDGVRRSLDCRDCDGTGEEGMARDGQPIECETCHGHGKASHMTDELKDLATALCKAQAAIEGASKDSTNPH